MTAHQVSAVTLYRGSLRDMTGVYNMIIPAVSMVVYGFLDLTLSPVCYNDVSR